MIIQPTVIIVEKDKPVKNSWDARALSQSIAKHKYQMSTLDNLTDLTAEKLNQKSGGLVIVSRCDLCLRTSYTN